jgi:hypothetical protein
VEIFRIIWGRGGAGNDFYFADTPGWRQEQIILTFFPDGEMDGSQMYLWSNAKVLINRAEFDNGII